MCVCVSSISPRASAQRHAANIQRELYTNTRESGCLFWYTFRMTRARAFTLIELLVVIAIIGILSAVVLASLGIARERAREANIRATLKNMASEIELLVDVNGGNYNFVNNCTSTSSPLARYVTALAAQGALVGCVSNNTTSTGDIYTRWGVTASLSGLTLPLTAWSASPEGVVKWDEADSHNGNSTNMNNAVSVCGNQGKRLASLEQLNSLWRITGTNAAPSFGSGGYWSGTEVPSIPANAYFSFMSYNYAHVGHTVKTNGGYVRCVQ